jgi:hypothetical protein
MPLPLVFLSEATLKLCVTKTTIRQKVTTSAWGQDAKYSLRVDVFRCYSSNGHAAAPQ